MYANYETLSISEKLSIMIKSKILAKQSDQRLQVILEERRFEASKIYVLGLKNFLFRKMNATKMKENVVDKLRSMLMAHHNNRWQKIMKIKKSISKINETEMMIARYQVNCFTDDKSKNQYESDFIAIKILIVRNKQAYHLLPKHEKRRMNLGMDKKVYELLMEKEMKGDKTMSQRRKSTATKEGEEK